MTEFLIVTFSATTVRVPLAAATGLRGPDGEEKL
jgi:hypothetical protein